MKSQLISLGSIILFTMIAATSPAFAQAPSACEEESGAAYGLCNAYCEAMDCDSEQTFASGKACQKVQDRFMLKTGRDLPCLVPPAECPCFSYQEVAEIAETQPIASDFWCYNEADSGSVLAQTIQSVVGIPFDPFEDWEASAFEGTEGREVQCEYRNMVWDGETSTEIQRLWVELPTAENRASYQACSDIISDVIEAYSLVCTGPN